MKSALPFLLAFSFLFNGNAQNVGIGTTVPDARLHVKGTVDITQLIIDANTIQSNGNPLLKFRSSDGTDLLWIHSDDASNIFIGKNAGISNDINTSGFNNCFIGNGAGYANTVGHHNIALGSAAFFNNVNGNSNTATGYAALTSNTSGSLNTATGFNALFYNTIGIHNTAFGAASLFSNTEGSYNSAIGVNALHQNIGDYNTAVGYNSLYANTYGSANTAVGYHAMRYNTTGVVNTAVGYDALASNTTGQQNTSIGTNALNRNTIGDFNTAVGFVALYNNTTGTLNTAFGDEALATNTTGSGNTAIGLNADNISGGLNNTTTIGYNAITNASNKVVIGNTSVTVIGGYVGWSNLSDSRFKKNIKTNVAGLEFIMRLKPVTYNMDVQKLNNFLGTTLNSDMDLKEKSFMYESIRQKEQIVYSGFEAQEVEKAAAAARYNFSGVIKPQNEKDHYSIVYSDFVPSLVKAIQEQQQIIEELRRKVEALEKRL